MVDVSHRSLVGGVMTLTIIIGNVFISNNINIINNSPMVRVVDEVEVTVAQVVPEEINSTRGS